MEHGLAWFAVRGITAAASYSFCWKEARSPAARLGRATEKVILTSAVLAGIMAIWLGMHNEGDDGGDSYTVQDYVPMMRERLAVFTEHFLVFAVPGLLGMFIGLRGRDPHEVGRQRDGHPGPVSSAVLGVRDLFNGTAAKRWKAEGRERARREIMTSLDMCDWPRGSRTPDEVARARANVLESHIRGGGFGREVALELRAKSSEPDPPSPAPLG